jgi:hypothetical protein
MTARQVHAVLAAGVQNPQLIARWQEDPGLLTAYGIEPEALDLTALWKFAGLTVKVRHNGLRQRLPMTFRLMSAAGLEIELFASYAGFCASKSRPFAETTEGRTADLIAFLEHWLNLDDPHHELLWDLIRHEEALARLRKAPLPSASRAVSSAGGAHRSLRTPSSTSVPHVCGEIILREMNCDPRAVERALRQSVPRLDRIRRERRYYCYWRPENAVEIHVLDLDEFGYYALSFVDGVRSTAGLSHQLGGSRRPSPGFLRSLCQLAAVGVVAFEGRSRARLT